MGGNVAGKKNDIKVTSPHKWMNGTNCVKEAKQEHPRLWPFL